MWVIITLHSTCIERRNDNSTPTPHITFLGGGSANYTPIPVFNRYVVVITALLLPQKLHVLRGGNNELYNTIHITCIGRE